MEAYIGSIEVSVLIFPLIGLLLFVPLYFAHKKRFGELNEYRAFVTYLCTFAFVAAMTLTILPLPSHDQPVCEWTSRLSRNQFVPFQSFKDVFTFAQKHGLDWTWQGMLANKALLQIVLNFAMLIPVGFLFRALYGQSLIRSILYGFLISLVFEMTQLTGIWGLAHCPYRVFDVDDLLTNTAGAVFGWALYSLFRWLPDPRASEDSLWYRKSKHLRKGTPGF